MKTKKFLTFAAVIVLCMMAGCHKTEENRMEEITKKPAEALTDAPLSELEGTLSPEKEGNALKYSFKEETEEEKDGEFMYFKSSLYYPVFEGKHAEHMNRFVATTTETFREALSEAKENAKYDYEDSMSAEYAVSIFPEKEEFTVSCLWETESYMTLFIKCVSTTGGVHPNVSCRAYVVDLENGSPESIEEMLASYEVTAEVLVEYAAEKIRKEHGEDLYTYDDADDLETDVYRFVKNNQWYFDENGLVLFANPYEIAAYAYGMIECEISYEELEQGLKK